MPLDPTSGTWMYTAADSAAPAPTLFNLLATSVRDVVASLRASRTALGTVLSDKSSLDQTGAVSADVVHADVEVVLTAGTWLVQGGATLINGTAADWACAGLWNQTSGAEVADSRGAGGVTSTTIGIPADTRPVVLTVVANTAIRVKAYRNGGSSLKFNGTGVAGAPAAWLTATRLK
ncbi:hypothetical protein ACTHAM_002417 [Cellulomonas soli]|uniref:hypothetical protein n=1 Tax=Cellulomonas soli TaxID=931535 RepID=UPI003F8543FA